MESEGEERDQALTHLDLRSLSGKKIGGSICGGHHVTSYKQVAIRGLERGG